MAVQKIKSKKFGVGDIVWYNIPENSEPGIVIECIYYSSIDTWKYEVSFGLEYSSILCTEIELSETKVLV